MGKVRVAQKAACSKNMAESSTALPTSNGESRHSQKSRRIEKASNQRFHSSRKRLCGKLDRRPRKRLGSAGGKHLGCSGLCSPSRGDTGGGPCQVGNALRSESPGADHAQAWHHPPGGLEKEQLLRSSPVEWELHSRFHHGFATGDARVDRVGAKLSPQAIAMRGVESESPKLIRTQPLASELSVGQP